MCSGIARFYVDALAACRCVATHTISPSEIIGPYRSRKSVSPAPVDANISKHMRAEFVTQRLLKFVTQ